jgi:hypothetical protein
VTDPYVGPRPFQRGEAALFFGRLGETRLLVSMVLASRVVLLYALSGAGKTSLLNASVVPSLEDEEFFEVLAPARVRGPAVESQPAAGVNPYVAGVLSYWTPDGGTSLPDLLGKLPHPNGPDGFPRPRAVILDQLEEVFTAYPDHWSERPEVFRQLAQALETDPLLRAILAIREDYLAQLEPFRDLLPGRLEARIRLELLDSDAAREAVTGPLQGTGRWFAPGVAERLVSDLRATAMTDEAGVRREFEAQHVEPVQLQLVCSALWRELPPYVMEITDDHVSRFGDVDQVLTDFYDGAISAAAGAAKVTVPSLRQAFADTFITAMHTRDTAYESGASVGSVPLAAAEELERRRLIRTEWRANARWYELTHDRLIEPIERSNQAALRRAVSDVGGTVRGALAALGGVLVAVVPATFVGVALTSPFHTLDEDYVGYSYASSGTYRTIVSAIVFAVAALTWALAGDRRRLLRRVATAFGVGAVTGAVAYGLAVSGPLALAYAVLGAIVGRAGIVAPGSWRAAAGAAVCGAGAGLLLSNVQIGATVLRGLILYTLIVAGAWLPDVVRAGWQAAAGDFVVTRPRALVAGLAAGVVAIGAIVGIAALQANSARSRSVAAQSRVLAAQSAGTSDDEVAALLAVEAARRSPTAEATDAMAAALARLQPAIKPRVGRIIDLALTGDGRSLAVAGTRGVIRLFDTRTRRAAGSLIGGSAPVTSLAFVPRTLTLAFTSLEGTLALGDPARRRLRVRYKVPALPLDVAVEPAGRYAATGGDRGVVAITTFGSGTTSIKRLGGGQEVFGVAFSGDGALAAGSGDGRVRILRIPRLNVVQVLGPVPGGAESVAFSPSGREIAAGAANGSVHVWRLDGATRLAILRDHTGSVPSVAWGAGRELLASGGEDGAVVVSSIASSQRLMKLDGFGGSVSSVVFTPDGRTLLTAGTDGTIRFLDAVLWSRDPARLRASICARVDRSLTLDEWDRYSPGEPYHDTCG